MSVDQQIHRLKNEIEALKGKTTQLDSYLKFYETRYLESLNRTATRVSSNLQKQNRKTEKATGKLSERVNSFERFNFVANCVVGLVRIISIFGFCVGIAWMISDWRGYYVILLSLLSLIVTISAIYTLKGRYSRPVVAARQEYQREEQILRHIKRELGMAEDAVRKVQSKLQEEKERRAQMKNRIQRIRERMKFLTEQKAKGFVYFVDRLSRERFGSPEQVREWKRMDMDMRNNFARLKPRQFEKLVGDLLKEIGYNVALTPKTADYGADIVAKKGKDTIVVQVKKYALTNKVSNRDIQRLLGSMWKYNANKAIFVTCSDYTGFAYKQARGAPIELWNHRILCEKIEKHILKF